MFDRLHLMYYPGTNILPKSIATAQLIVDTFFNDPDIDIKSKQMHFNHLSQKLSQLGKYKELAHLIRYIPDVCIYLKSDTYYSHTLASMAHHLVRTDSDAALRLFRAVNTQRDTLLSGFLFAQLDNALLDQLLLAFKSDPYTDKFLCVLECMALAACENFDDSKTLGTDIYVQIVDWLDRIEQATDSRRITAAVSCVRIIYSIRADRPFENLQSDINRLCTEDLHAMEEGDYFLVDGILEVAMFMGNHQLIRHLYTVCAPSRIRMVMLIDKHIRLETYMASLAKIGDVDRFNGELERRKHLLDSSICDRIIVRLFRIPHSMPFIKSIQSLMPNSGPPPISVSEILFFLENENINENPDFMSRFTIRLDESLFTDLLTFPALATTLATPNGRFVRDQLKFHYRIMLHLFTFDKAQVERLLPMFGLPIPSEASFARPNVSDHVIESNLLRYKRTYRLSDWASLANEPSFLFNIAALYTDEPLHGWMDYESFYAGNPFTIREYNFCKRRYDYNMTDFIQSTEWIIVLTFFGVKFDDVEFTQQDTSVQDWCLKVHRLHRLPIPLAEIIRSKFSDKPLILVSLTASGRLDFEANVLPIIEPTCREVGCKVLFRDDATSAKV